MLCRERYIPPTGTYWPARAPGTHGYGSVQLQRTGQLDLDFLQHTSPRHWDDLARTSHIQRLQTKLNKVPVWVYKAQNTVEARGFCCTSLYGCMCCMSLWGSELQERADIYRTKLQKAHIRNCTVYHIPTSCVWREMDMCVCWLASRDNGGAQGNSSTSCETSSLLKPAVLALGWALHCAQREAISSCSMEYVHVF